MKDYGIDLGLVLGLGIRLVVSIMKQFGKKKEGYFSHCAQPPFFLLFSIVTPFPAASFSFLSALLPSPPVFTIQHQKSSNSI